MRFALAPVVQEHEVSPGKLDWAFKVGAGKLSHQFPDSQDKESTRRENILMQCSCRGSLDCVAGHLLIQKTSKDAAKQAAYKTRECHSFNGCPKWMIGKYVVVLLPRRYEGE
jgi:hypothetical protein